jgi:putative ABC transport system permease protein
MLRFLIKGIFRDRHRYLFPLILVSGGIAVLVFALSFMQGYMESYIRYNAHFETGHLKVVTRSYSEKLRYKPCELAMLDIGEDLEAWKDSYPQLDWAQRIYFGALLDIPDSSGVTREQADVISYGVDLSENSQEREFLNLDKALVKGTLPRKPGDLLISSAAFEKLGIAMGDSVLLLSSTVDGAMAFGSFRVCGSVNFGILSLDRGAVILDIDDARSMLEMEGDAGEILAWFKNGVYNAPEAGRIKEDFNRRYSGDGDFDPVMLALTDQNNMGRMMSLMSQSLAIVGFVFILILGIVLWNSGLMNGIRRWGEFGIRLAIGESKSHVYGSLLIEAAVIGVVGSVIGSLLGFAVILIFTGQGIDLSAYSKTSTIMMDNIIYLKIRPANILAGVIPGVLSTLLGAALAGIAIYRRQTSQLSKELEQ